MPPSACCSDDPSAATGSATRSCRSASRCRCSRRRALVGGVRARRDPADALARRRRRARRLAVGRSRGGRRDGRSSSRRTGRTCTRTRRGGGDYEVATVNLGPNAGVTVASALLVDYVLTVAVSISSGAQYAATAFPALRGHEAAFAVGLVVLLTLANLRGVKESGQRCSPIPVYLFMFAIGAIAPVGCVRFAHGQPADGGERAASTSRPSRVRPGLTGLAGVLPDPARVRVGLCRAHRRRGDQQRRPGVQEAEVQERGDDARAARRPLDHDDHVDPAARERDAACVRRRPADAAAARRRARRRRPTSSTP